MINRNSAMIKHEFSFAPSRLPGLAHIVFRARVAQRIYARVILSIFAHRQAYTHDMAYTRYLLTDTCVHSPYERRTPAHWILTAAALAGSVASSLFGGAKARSASKRANRELQTRSAQESAWYQKNRNTDYLDTQAGQRLLTRADEAQNKYIRRAEGSSAVGGATASATAQAKEAANRTMGDAIAQIGAHDTARKQQVDDQHLASQQQLSRDRQATENNRAAQTTAAAQQASNALMSAAVSLEGGTAKSSAPASSGAASGGTATTPSGGTADPIASPNGVPIQSIGQTAMDALNGNPTDYASRLQRSMSRTQWFDGLTH